VNRREFSEAVRTAALVRAKMRCEQCSRRDDLEFHHVGHRADPSLFNCQVLCATCHLAEHRKRRK